MLFRRRTGGIHQLKPHIVYEKSVDQAKTPQGHFLRADPRDPNRLITADAARGPWDPDGAHGGVGAAVLARALERLVPEKRLCRMTIDLIRPVPMGGLRTEVQVTRNGRSVATANGCLLDDHGEIRVTATALYQSGTAMTDVPTTHFAPPSNPNNDATSPFPIRRIVGHDLPNISDAMTVRYPTGQNGSPGPTTVWIKTLDLVEGELTSPWQRAAIVGDCPNGFGRNAEPWDISFINPDLTIHLHRDPVGTWIGLQIVSRWEPTGHGVAEALMFDTEGAVGRVVQTLLLRSAVDRKTECSGD